MGKKYDSEKTRKKNVKRRLRKQEVKAAFRAKYGPSMRPAPVIVKSLETGEVIEGAKVPGRAKQHSPVLDELARDAGYESYTGYLHSAEWRSLRLKVLTRDGWRCRLCGAKKSLRVHHDRYGPLGEIPLKWLKTVCDPCHRRIHNR